MAFAMKKPLGVGRNCACKCQLVGKIVAISGDITKSAEVMKYHFSGSSEGETDSKQQWAAGRTAKRSLD